jgi:hypothetical protein
MASNGRFADAIMRERTSLRNLNESCHRPHLCRRGGFYRGLIAVATFTPVPPVILRTAMLASVGDFHDAREAS